MKLLAVLLLALLATPVVAQEKLLTHDELLAQTDDATAAELRWILNADFLAVNAVGISGEYLRQAVAYRRLLAAKEIVEFQRLLKSTNDVAACFGIKGLCELDAAKLLPHLPALVVRQHPLLEGSGDVAGRTTVAIEAVEAVKQLDNSGQALAQAWSIWLSHLAAHPNTASYDTGPFHDLFGNTAPKGASAEVMQVTQFLQVLAGDDSVPALRKHARSQESALLAQLCVRALADRGACPHNAILETIWLRELDGDDAALNLRISVEYWRRRADLVLDPNAPERVKDYIDCPLHALTDADWKWLKEHKHPGIRQSALQLWENPISSWRMDVLPGEGSANTTLWALCALHATESEDARTAARAKVVLARLLRDSPKLLTGHVLERQWDSDTVSEQIAAQLGPSVLLPIAKSAILAKDGNTLPGGLCLLVDLARKEKNRKKLWHSEGMSEVRTLLLQQGETDAANLWRVRGALIALAEALEDVDAEFTQSVQAARVRWCSALARTLVSLPMVMPPYLVFDNSTPPFEYLDHRAGRLCEAIYQGSNQFVPDEELGESDLAEDSPTLAELLKRMRAALAKLDE